MNNKARMVQVAGIKGSRQSIAGVEEDAVTFSSLKKPQKEEADISSESDHSMGSAKRRFGAQTSKTLRKSVIRNTNVVVESPSPRFTIKSGINASRSLNRRSIKDAKFRS